MLEHLVDGLGNVFVDGYGVVCGTKRGHFALAWRWVTLVDGANLVFVVYN